MFGLTPKELKILKKLNTPAKIQDYLDRLPINFEQRGETLMSPRRVLREKKAHCIEAAMFAALTLWVSGEEPLLMDFQTKPHDEDHVIAVFKKNGYWGAISKTNHAILRYRDPIYKSYRELAMSYFHEYLMNETGEKTLLAYSKPFNMKKLGTRWITTEKDMWEMEDILNAVPHFPAIPAKNKKYIRKADPVVRRVGKAVEWEPTRTTASRVRESHP